MLNTLKNPTSPRAKSLSFGIKGRVRCDVIDHTGKVVKEGQWKDNLWLDSGMNILATIPLCQAFEWCAKGTGTFNPVEVTTTTYKLQSGTLTLQSGARTFNNSASPGTGDIGKIIVINGTVGQITAVTGSNTATISNQNGPDISASHTITFYDVLETTLGTEEVGAGSSSTRTNTYSNVATENGTATASNVRTFTRTFVFAPNTADATYTEVGFSENGNAAGTVNVRVLLGSPVTVDGPSGGNPGQQLKVTYVVTLTVTPNTSTAGASGITGSPWNGSGHYVIETFATSTVATDGSTDLTQPDLEPYYPGTCGLCPGATALAPFGDTDRSNGVTTTPLTADAYIPTTDSQTFQQTYEAVFGVNDAIGTTWQNIMLYDPNSGQGIFTFQYSGTKAKDGTHALLIIFQKIWGRTLT